MLTNIFCCVGQIHLAIGVTASHSLLLSHHSVQFLDQAMIWPLSPSAALENLQNTDLTKIYIDIWKTIWKNIFFHLIKYILLFVQTILEQAIIWLLHPDFCETDTFDNLESYIYFAIWLNIF